MNEFYWVAVAVTTVISSARITRLTVYDDFPPIEWLREKLNVGTIEQAQENHWKLLAVCGFCMSFWVTALVIGWGYLSGVYGDGDAPVGQAWPWFLLWWLVNGTFAASYLAAMTVARDGDES